MIVRNMSIWGITNDDARRTGFAEISNVVVDNCNHGLVTNDAVGMRVRNAVVVNNATTAIQAFDHNTFEVSHSLFFNNGALLLQNEDFCSPNGPYNCEVTFGAGIVQDVDPLLFDATAGGRVLPSYPPCDSPVVDAGDPDPTFDDQAFPPSLGAATNDIGAYGGPGADLDLTTVEQGELLQQAGCAPIFECVGFDPPLAAGPIKVRQQRVLPLKAQLLDFTGQPKTDIELAAPPVVQVLFTAQGEDEAVDVTDEALPAGLGDEGNQFVFSGDRWRFNLKTKPYSAPGSYSIELVSGDPTEYGVESCRVELVVE